ncbi:protein transport protein Sec24C isoform X2 [Cylas formicarius]|uniref:protein transport protein Sec24C isoform X2 n=1 Tax=Cylas formicarius TaxID=197179 RepID=UPI002958C5C1|nr:protein transport protein Sec24C isoform X2 [Cylas formicarius]
MNSQYLPPPSLGNSQPDFSAQSNVGDQNFQNVPLGPPKTGAAQNFFPNQGVPAFTNTFPSGLTQNLNSSNVTGLNGPGQHQVNTSNNVPSQFSVHPPTSSTPLPPSSKAFIPPTQLPPVTQLPPSQLPSSQLPPTKISPQPLLSQRPPSRDQNYETLSDSRTVEASKGQIKFQNGPSQQQGTLGMPGNLLHSNLQTLPHPAGTQNQFPPNSGPASSGPISGVPHQQMPPRGGPNQPPNQPGFPPNMPAPSGAPLQGREGFPLSGGPPLNNFPPTSGALPFGGPPPVGPGKAPPLPGGASNAPPLGPSAQQFAPPSQQPPINPPLPGTAPVAGAHPIGQRPRQQNYPPMPGTQLPPNQFPPQSNLPPGGGYRPGQLPPMPNQPASGPNQLSSQFQGMNLGGPHQYLPNQGNQFKNVMNGENGPHMPPPLNQQPFINGQQQQQQMRGPQAPGFPPMPPQPMGGGYPQPQYPQQPQQQQKRLDPDQMPSPIQVTQDDQNTRSGVFVTAERGTVPPLVTTNFIVQDQGNASPRFIRSSMYNVPISQDIMKQTAVPFSLVISPMARTMDEEYPPPLVNFGELGPVRCIRCKAYMCPFMHFLDSGRRFQCLFCKATTDVPAEYFQHLDHTGRRLDRLERPELVLGTYEFVATADYCRDNKLPKPPAMIFIIDVSYNNIKSGLVHLLSAHMKEIVRNLPVDQGHEKSNMKVGFITYNSSVHFYNIKGTLAAPQMMIVGDTQEMFMPLLDGFLCTPEESESMIDALLEQIPAMFEETKETETVLLPAILAGLEALKASECAGKLLVFHSSLPTAEAPGKLRNRDDRKLLGTDKEKTVLSPQTQAYNQLGQDCVAAGCSVDLFVFNNSYIDIATIGQVSRLTGGEVFKYTYFQADVDGERLIQDVIMDVSRPIAFDSIMRVRTSTGIRPTDFYGHFYMSNTTDMELAAIDCDKAVSVEIKHDDKLSEDEGVYIQAALLYTSCSGQRRLRIMNLSLKVCSQMADLYRSCDLDTIINYISKQCTYKLLENSPKTVKDAIVNRAAQILATYRKHCASPSSAGQLILPECMKLLPLYVNCLLKSDALSGGSDMTIDDRSFMMQCVMMMDVPTSVNYFYPRLVPLHDIEGSSERTEIPAPIRCTAEKMSEQGVYILENGIHMFLWVGLDANPEFVRDIFGTQSAHQVDIDRVKLPDLDNPRSVAVRNIIELIRVQRHRCMRLTIVKQKEKLEPIFRHFLVEDRGTDGSASYVDFLCHMHREIRSLLS